MSFIHSICDTFLSNLILIQILIAITVFYTYYGRKYSYWSSQGIKTPKPVPFFGNTIDLLTTPILTILDSRWTKYGPLYGSYQGTIPHLVLGDPELLKQALVKDWQVFAARTLDGKNGNIVSDNMLGNANGSDWKRLRSVMSPTFTSGKMKSMFAIIDDCCKLMVRNIEKRIDNQIDQNYNRVNNQGKELELNIHQNLNRMDSQEKELELDIHQNLDRMNGQEKELELDMRHLAGCYSMDVIAKCCFATETNSFDDPNDTFVKNTKEFFQVPAWRRFARIFLPNYIKRMIGFTVNPKQSVEFLTHVARRVLDDRLKDKTNVQLPNDYLQLLIDASKHDKIQVKETVPDHESHHGNEEGNGDSFVTIHSKLQSTFQPLTKEEIIANSVLFLAVGYDTTSLLITFTVYSLAVDEEIQSKLFHEISTAHEQNGGKFDYETISSLKYLDAVISESLRLYPSATMMERKVMEDYTFTKSDIEDGTLTSNNCGIKVPKGASVWLPIWNLHRDPKYWNNPEIFDPDRFLPQNRSKIVPYTYIPFGGGPRNCIGMRFALLEAKLAIAHLILNFQFGPCSKTDIPLDLSPTLGILKPKRVIVNVCKRERNGSDSFF